MLHGLPIGSNTDGALNLSSLALASISLGWMTLDMNILWWRQQPICQFAPTNLHKWTAWQRNRN